MRQITINRILPTYKIIILILVFVMLFVVLSYNYWLPSIASFLIVNDKIVPSDIIVVLSLDENRLKYAVKLLNNGYGKIVAASCGEEDFDYFNIFVEADSAIKRYLLDLGVRNDQLQLITNVTSTYDEANRVKELVIQNGYQTLIVVSNPFHLRRSKFIFSKVLNDLEVKLYFSGPPLEEFNMSVDGWWTREKEIVWIFEEYLKLILYWFRY